MEGGDFVTKSQLYRKVKSLVWRRNIAETLEQLESEIKSYMLGKDTKKLVSAGYLVKLIEDNLVLEKLPAINLRQMEFGFQKEEGEAYVFQSENAGRLGGFGSCVSQEQNLRAQKNQT